MSSSGKKYANTRAGIAAFRAAVPATSAALAAFRARIQATPDDIRAKCAQLIEEIPRLLAPNEGRRKEQYRLLEWLTGIPARRLRALRRGEVPEPPGHQERTLDNAHRLALALWRESALEQLEHIEVKRADVMRAAAGRDLSVRAGGGELGDSFSELGFKKV